MLAPNVRAWAAQLWCVGSFSFHFYASCVWVCVIGSQMESRHMLRCVKFEALQCQFITHSWTGGPSQVAHTQCNVLLFFYPLFALPLSSAGAMAAVATSVWGNKFWIHKKKKLLGIILKHRFDVSHFHVPPITCVSENSKTAEGMRPFQIDLFLTFFNCSESHTATIIHSVFFMFASRTGQSSLKST